MFSGDGQRFSNNSATTSFCCFYGSYSSMSWQLSTVMVLVWGLSLNMQIKLKWGLGSTRSCSGGHLGSHHSSWSGDRILKAVNILSLGEFSQTI